MDYSVLMSVYKNENPAFLRLAIDSMLNQTVPPAQFLLICDGTLPKPVDEVIDSYGSRLEVIRLPENKGLGEALRVGLLYCRHELVARMDSDDISLSDRCEKQLAVLTRNNGPDIISGTVEEFTDDPNAPVSRRVVPLTHEEIVAYSKRRCPFNHPAVMFKKQAVLDAGNYSGKYLYNEDYDLWMRMIANGARTANLADVLLKQRSPAEQIQRRGGRAYAKSFHKLRRSFLKQGWISRKDFMLSAYPQYIVCVMPNGMRGAVYRFVRRKEGKQS